MDGLINLDGLINFKSVAFKAPQDFREALKSGIEAHNIKGFGDKSAVLAAHRLSREDGEVTSAYIIKGLNWWNESGGAASEDERKLYGGENGKTWFEKCAKEIQSRKEVDAERKAANEMQYKKIGSGSIKDVDATKRIVTGHFSEFHNWDSVNEMVMPGAYKKSIKEWGPKGKDRIKTLLQHDPTLLLGKPIILAEDEKGLYHESLITETSYGLDTLKLIEDKVITEQSVGYSVLDYKMDKETEGIKLTSLKLFEGSFVTWGANEFATISGVKAMTDPNDVYKTITEMLVRMEKSLRSGYWETDEVPTMVELTTKKLYPMLEQLGQLTDLDDSLENSEAVIVTKSASSVESVAVEEQVEETSANEPEFDPNTVLTSLKAALEIPESKEHEDKEKELKDFFRGLQNELFSS